jgi:Probable transposase.
MEVVYEPKDVTQSLSGVEGIAGIDIGLNNLATITSNQKGFVPLIINGKPLKSINAYYHKNKAVFQSYLKGEKKTSIKIEQFTHKRNVKSKIITCIMQVDSSSIIWLD